MNVGKLLKNLIIWSRSLQRAHCDMQAWCFFLIRHQTIYLKISNTINYYLI